VEGDGRSRVVPLFPLVDVWLFPAVILPLHVFEPRYRALIADCLDGPGRIVLGTIRAGHEGDAAGAPPIYPLAGLGEIGRHERRADGRFDVLLVGLARVLASEVASDRPYRRVRIRAMREKPIDPGREPELRARVLAALRERTEDLPAVPDTFSTGHLVDLLVLRLAPPHAAMNRLFALLDVEERARSALSLHEGRPAGGP
jgi:Lon protease-like protein